MAAIAVIGLVVIVRSAGFGHLAARWLEEDGQADGARAMRWAAALIWTGAMMSTLGGILSSRALFVAGLIVMGSNLIPLAWYAQVASRARRS